MTNYSTRFDQTFQALADPTRRTVLERLSLGPATVSELAAAFNMALPSFMQHLKVLEASGLVSSEKVGRVRTYRLVPEALKLARDWLDDRLNVWGNRLNQLDSLLLELAKHEQETDK